MRAKNLLAVDVEFMGHSPRDPCTFVRPNCCGDCPEVGDFVLTSTLWPRTKRASKQTGLEALAANAVLARVIKVHEVPFGSDHRFYAVVVPMHSIITCHAAAQRYGQHAARTAELMAQLETLMQAPEMQIQRYEVLARMNPEAAPLVEELKKLT